MELSESLFSLIPHSALQSVAALQVVAHNNTSARYGLSLTHAEATELVATQSRALADTGRVSFGGGVIEALIDAFCDSPYLSQRDWAEALHELVELFYYMKTETDDTIGDGELIDRMKRWFDGRCGGSLELLAGRELEALARRIRFGEQDDFCLDGEASEGSAYDTPYGYDVPLGQENWRDDL